MRNSILIAFITESGTFSSIAPKDLGIVELFETSEWEVTKVAVGPADTDSFFQLFQDKDYLYISGSGRELGESIEGFITTLIRLVKVNKLKGVFSDNAFSDEYTHRLSVELPSVFLGTSGPMPASIGLNVATGFYQPILQGQRMPLAIREARQHFKMEVEELYGPPDLDLGHAEAMPLPVFHYRKRPNIIGHNIPQELPLNKPSLVAIGIQLSGDLEKLKEKLRRTAPDKPYIADSTEEIAVADYEALQLVLEVENDDLLEVKPIGSLKQHVGKQDTLIWPVKLKPKGAGSTYLLMRIEGFVSDTDLEGIDTYIKELEIKMDVPTPKSPFEALRPKTWESVLDIIQRGEDLKPAVQIAIGLTDNSADAIALAGRLARLKKKKHLLSSSEYELEYRNIVDTLLSLWDEWREEQAYY